MKIKAKKILTGLLCLVIVFAIVSLCSVAYFKEATTPESGTYTFVDVSVTGNTGFDGNAQNGSNSYYVSLNQVKNNTRITYGPTVTNNGDREIIPYIVVAYPIVGDIKAENSYIPFQPLELDAQSKWIKVKSKTRNTSIGSFYFAIYGYKELIGPGQTTDPLCSDIITRATPFFPQDTHNQMENGYIKIPIQTTAIGLQNPIDALDNIRGEYKYYNKDLTDKTHGMEGIVLYGWNDMIENELSTYLAYNIFRIDNSIPDAAS